MAVIYWACNVNGKRLGRINTVSYEKLRISFEDTDHRNYRPLRYGSIVK